MRSRRALTLVASVVVLGAATTPASAADNRVADDSDPIASCELFAFRGSAPMPEEREVPIDARVLVAYEACGTGTAKISLLEDGLPVDGVDVYGFSSDASWATFKPRDALKPQTRYVVVLETDRGTSVLRFTTGTQMSPPDAEARPSLRVLSAQYTSKPLMPDGRARADVTLELTHPKSGPLGAFYLGGPKRVENSTSLVTDRLALADGRLSVPVLQTIETRPGEPACFSVLYEDAAGRLSTASEPACAVVPGKPEGTSDDAKGCAASPRVAARERAAGGASAIVVGVAAVAVRRRRRRAS